MAGLLACLVAFYAGDLTGQQQIVIGDAPACAECGISLEKIATIYDEDGRAGMGSLSPPDMLRSAAGRYFVIIMQPYEALLFDENGGYLRRLGRDGEGPGEFKTARSLIEGAGDTVWVVDSGLGRRTAWSPEGEFLDVQRLIPGRLTHAAALQDGSWIMSGPVMTPESVGRPLHRIGADGGISLSFGPEHDVSGSAHLPGWIRRTLAAGADGNLWTASRYAYQLEKYDPEGELLATITRNAPWFPERDPQAPSGSLAEDGPTGRLVDLVDRGDGVVHTLTLLPDENWPEALGERELQPGFEAAGVYWTPVVDHGKLWDFVIEVVDTRRGEVLVRKEFDQMPLGWLDRNHIATYRTDDLDVPIIDIHRVNVTGVR